MNDRTDGTEQDKKVVLDLFVRKGGVVSAICAAAGIGRSTYYRWQKEDKAFAEALAEKDEELIDHGEAALMRAIARNNMTAIIFFLKCKGKKRGWVERQELSGPNGGPIQTQPAIDLSNVPDELLQLAMQLGIKLKGTSGSGTSTS